jgi:hypothetical protein
MPQLSRLAEFGGRGMSFNICRGNVITLRISTIGLSSRHGRAHGGYLASRMRAHDRRDRYAHVGQVASGRPLDRRISNIAPLDTAVAADISFLDKPQSRRLRRHVPAPASAARALKRRRRKDWQS